LNIFRHAHIGTWLAAISGAVFAWEPLLAYGTDSGSNCVRYVWANAGATPSENARLQILACTQIVNHRATSCSKIGSLDMAKLKATEKAVKDKIWSYGQGLASAMGCIVALDLRSAFLPRTVGIVDYTGTNSAATYSKWNVQKRARKNVLNGSREPGDLPSPERDEIYKSPSAQACAYLKRKRSGDEKAHES